MFDAVREQKRPGLIVFVTAGFPDMEATLELVPALVAAGADAVELGVPFSDPLAEGPVIQESSFRALQNGTSLEDCLNAAETLREQIPDTPLILMGYYNPIHTYGLVKFTQRCHQAGVDGLIAVDLPGFEAAPLMAECRTRDISMIPLLAPTSTDGSIQDACAGASGFIYCISVTGVTGVRDQVSGRSFELLDRVKAHTNLPLAVGFGISNRAHVEAVGKTAEAAVVGSALIKVMLESPREELVERTSRFVAELAGVSLPG
ncbi:MAG: tryptophan synthase subunit alpha [Chloroflexi bacterium]|nr:tryptophan synthase subunit alpha [Chloroflexota bacterium]